MRAGSVCSGYGGLEMGLSMVLDFELAWVADIDPGASKILAHRYPGVPNLGDITKTDWSKAEQVDIFLAGFPCTDISGAGLGEGILEGNRSGVWFDIARGIRALRPRLVVLENVRRIVSRRPGLDVVLASLADLGFDAEWLCLPASGVGAAHERYRWFCLAWPAAADTASDGRDEGRPEPKGLVRRSNAPLGCRGAAADSADLGHQRRGEARGRRGGPADGRDVDWREFTPAIRRWERVLGRPVPAPTVTGSKGQPKLSPYFDEWFMGLPAGWVTDVPGLTVNQMIHACGNGVVPLQAARAVGVLLERAAAPHRERQPA